MPAPKKDKDGNPVEDIRVVEQADGSAYVPGVFTEGHEPGEDEDDDAEPAGGSVEPGTDANGNGETAEAAELAQAETDEEREAIRARRRQERADKKRRAAEKLEMLERELRETKAALADQSQRMGAVERRASSTDLAQIDDAIRNTAGNVEKLKKAIENGTKSGDGVLVANATARMMEETQRLSALQNAKGAYIQHEQQRVAQGAQRQAAPDPRIQNAARAWAARNTWYDPAAGGETNAIVRAIDQSLTNEGRNPADASYWEELDRRIAHRLPEVTDGKMRAHAQGKPSGGARVAGSGSDSTSSGGSAKGYTLSPARVQALKDAGMWDDTAARAKAIESYRKYDRAHGSAR